MLEIVNTLVKNEVKEGVSEIESPISSEHSSSNSFLRNNTESNAVNLKPNTFFGTKSNSILPDPMDENGIDPLIEFTDNSFKRLLNKDGIINTDLIPNDDDGNEWKRSPRKRRTQKKTYSLAQPSDLNLTSLKLRAEGGKLNN